MYNIACRTANIFYLTVSTPANIMSIIVVITSLLESPSVFKNVCITEGEEFPFPAALAASRSWMIS